jgi:hypothetical protein
MAGRAGGGGGEAGLQEEPLVLLVRGQGLVGWRLRFLGLERKQGTGDEQRRQKEDLRRIDDSS